MIARALQNLIAYIEKENYSGYDPYDALKSPLFRLPFFRTNKIARFVAQQLVKRFPANLRPLFFVPKGYNPVTLGLCIQAYSNLTKTYPENKNEYEKKINYLIDELVKLIPAGFHGACWGYDFDWEARYSKIPSYQPTVVATGIITHALFNAYRHTGNKKAMELCISAAKFVLNDLNRTMDEDGDFCFSYSPFDKQVVFNASMKGARLLAEVYSITGDEQLKNEAKKAVAFVIKYRRSDGAWIYSANLAGGWIDNYHTGYILDCLDEYMTLCDDSSYELSLEKGYKFYAQNFFYHNSIPKFYDKELYPIDCTAAAQSILTLTRFKDYKLAENVAGWMILNMQDDEGYFYFRKYKFYTEKTSFMRWSNAWMMLALSELLTVNR
ncbi:MAG TPA: delta-aminolevulinic acid dehydratase [Bacteroidia bacterium]|nr:delta-aminolevulinic acid dehydratase [Bacteroidia bacterium]